MNFKVLVCFYVLVFAPLFTTGTGTGNGTVTGTGLKTIDVTNPQYGMSSNDITNAIMAAFTEACTSAVATKIIIPVGTYMLGETVMEGPCKAPLEFEIQATLLAPVDHRLFKAKGSWITFKRIDYLSVFGQGTLDGQGATAWAACGKGDSCANMPTNLKFFLVNHGRFEGITSVNSKHFHACISHTKDLTIRNVKIQAPDASPNTDGIHIGHSADIQISHSIIQTGDDCISMIHGNQRINITGVTCGPGHGISIGSLGKFRNEGPVDGITVTNCSFINTDNGLRVKTWPNGRLGSASNIRFEDIRMVNVTNPIIIDQTYCPHNTCSKGHASHIKIQNVIIKGVQGTSGTARAVKLTCSSAVPCQNVQISNIDLTCSTPGCIAKSECSNVQPILSGIQNPPLCTMS